MSIASYRAQIADYSRQIEDARARIAQLERALDGLDDFDAAMVRELASREDAVQQKRALVYRLQAVPNARVVQSCSEILNRNISQVMAQFEEGYAGVRAEIAPAGNATSRRSRNSSGASASWREGSGTPKRASARSNSSSGGLRSALRG